VDGDKILNRLESIEHVIHFYKTLYGVSKNVNSNTSSNFVQDIILKLVTIEDNNMLITLHFV